MICIYGWLDDILTQRTRIECVPTLLLRERTSDNGEIHYCDQLSKMGTLEAYEGLHRIAGKLPELELAKYMLVNALKTYCNESWKPTEPEHILELFENQEKRLVESGDQLVEVLLESLKRLEKKLHDETPASRDIWDLINRKKKLYRPIYEDELSDYVKRHLSEDIGKRGIVLGRNTRIHRGRRN